MRLIEQTFIIQWNVHRNLWIISRVAQKKSDIFRAIYGNRRNYAMKCVMHFLYLHTFHRNQL